MSVLSLNNHYTGHVDFEYRRNLPIRPETCLKSVYGWLLDCHLDKDKVHEVVLPGVREGLVILAYHSLMGHFPIVWYSMRENGVYIWLKVDAQEWREKARSCRS